MKKDKSLYKVTAECSFFSVEENNISSSKVTKLVKLINKMKRFYCSDVDFTTCKKSKRFFNEVTARNTKLSILIEKV